MSGMTIEQLRERARGAVIERGDDGYDEARVVYNAMIDRRPRVVVRCSDAGDVVAAVDFARENGLDLAVRGGAAAMRCPLAVTVWKPSIASGRVIRSCRW